MMNFVSGWLKTKRERIDLSLFSCDASDYANLTGVKTT